MQAYRENADKMIDLLSTSLPGRNNEDAKVWDEVVEFLRECRLWLPPKYAYDQYHAQKDRRKKAQEENS